MQFREWNVLYFDILISPRFVPNGPIDSKSALVQVKPKRQTGNKTSPEPMLTQIAGAYVRYRVGTVVVGGRCIKYAQS